MRASGLVYPRETTMPKSNREPSTAETGEQLPARPHDSGSQANETVDGLDASTEALQHAADDTLTGVNEGHPAPWRLVGWNERGRQREARHGEGNPDPSGFGLRPTRKPRNQF